MRLEVADYHIEIDAGSAGKEEGVDDGFVGPERPLDTGQ